MAMPVDGATTEFQLGHGVCGIARLSPRPLDGTAIFMATGFATVYVMRHVIGG